jgi:hypothetical protein
MSKKVKLNNGKEVTLDEFITWHPQKQHQWTIPIEEKRATIEKTAAKKRRVVITPKGQFASLREATKALNMSKDALVKLIHNTAYPEYNYLDPKYIDKNKLFHKVYKVGPKKTVTPIGIFRSKIEAANALGILKDQLGKLMITNPDEYYYAEDGLNKSEFKR